MVRFLLLLLACLARGSLSIIVTGEKVSMPESSNTLHVFANFGFKAGGVFNYTLRASVDSSGTVRPRTVLFACRDDEYQSLLDDYTDREMFCEMVRAERAKGFTGQVGCDRMWSYPESGEDALRVSGVVPGRAKLWFALTNCDEQSITGEQDYVFVNPGGEHLGSGHYPLPRVYAVLIAAWCVASLAFAVSLYRNRGVLSVCGTGGTGGARLHATIMPVPLLYVGVAAMSFVRWDTCSRTGECTRGVGFRVAAAVLVAVHHTLSLTLLLLLAKGWYITRTRLSSVESRTIMVVASLQFIVTFFNSYYGGYVLLAVLLVYIGAMWYVFSSVGGTIKSLRAQLVSLRQIGLDVPSTPAHAKARMITAFQRGLVAYLCLSVLNFFVGNFFLVELPWIRVFIEEALDFLLFVVVMVVFRLRGARVVTNAARLPLTSQGGHGAATSTVEGAGASEMDAAAGAVVAPGPGSALAPMPSSMVPWSHALPPFPFASNYPVHNSESTGGAGGNPNGTSGSGRNIHSSNGNGGHGSSGPVAVLVVQNPATEGPDGKLVASIGIAAPVQAVRERPDPSPAAADANADTQGRSDASGDEMERSDQDRPRGRVQVRPRARPETDSLLGDAASAEASDP